MEQVSLALDTSSICCALWGLRFGSGVLSLLFLHRSTEFGALMLYYPRTIICGFFSLVLVSLTDMGVSP